MGAEYRGHEDFQKVWQRDGGRCQHCRKELDLRLRGGTNELSPELDHIIPISRGGVAAEYNVQLLCRGCNLKKGNKIYESDRIKADSLWPEAPEKAPPVDGRSHVLSRPGGSCGYRGVAVHGGGYRAKIDHNGRAYRSYGHRSPEEAALAYNGMARMLGIDERYWNTVDNG